MTSEHFGSVSCLAKEACVDVVMVVPALLNAAGRLMLIVGSKAVGPRSDVVGISKHRHSLSSPHLVFGVNASSRRCVQEVRRGVQQV